MSDSASTDAVASAIGTMSITNTSSATTQSPPARVNFPLPRELRNQIYGYLLSHEYVHDDPWHKRPNYLRGVYSTFRFRFKSDAHTYRFHPNILSINHTMRQEALGILHKNHFVVFSYQYPLVSKSIHDLGLPIVTENQTDVSRFKSFAVRVHVKGPRAEMTAQEQVQSLLMLRSDFPALQDLLQYVYQNLHTTAKIVVVHDTPDDPVRRSESTVLITGAKADVLPSFMARFQTSAPLALNIEQTKSVLAVYKNVVFGNQRVTFQNIPTELEQHASSIKKSMSPPAIWLEAMAWRMYESLQRIKSCADDLARCGHYRQASTKYGSIWIPLAHFLVKGVPKEAIHSNYRFPSAALHSVCMGALITDAFLCLRNLKKKSEVFDAVGILSSLWTMMIHNCPSSMTKTLNVWTINSGVRHMTEYLCMLTAFLSADHGVEFAQKAADFHNLIGKVQYSHTEHCTRDQQCLGEVSSDTQVIHAFAVRDWAKFGHLFCHKFTALFEKIDWNEVPAQVVDFGMPDGITKPDGLDGLINWPVLERLRTSNPAMAAQLE